MKSESPGALALGQPARYLLATVIAIVFLTPLAVALNTSLKTPAEIVDVLSLPSAPSLASYSAAW